VRVRIPMVKDVSEILDATPPEGEGDAAPAD
jgi:hypothetical protein